MRRTSCVFVFSLILATAPAFARKVLSPTRYELGVEIDYQEKVLRGTARITLQNPHGMPVRDVSLLLYRLLKVRNVHNHAGTKLSFTQSVVAFDDFPQLQVNHLLVPLSRPLPAGGQTTIVINYDGHLLGYAETGMKYVQDRIDPEFTILRLDAYAYPQPGYPSLELNRAIANSSFTYSARITVPKGLTVANGGLLEGVTSTDARETFQFTSLKPSWRMDFAIANYGQLSSGPVHVYYLPGDQAGAEGVASAATKALDLFTRWFGPLPKGGALTFIEVPEGWGSQADVTTVIQTASAFRDPNRHHEVYHEVSHLWNVPSTDLPSPRWNEGLASFLEDLVDQEVTGKQLLDERAMKVMERLCAALPNRPQWKKVPLVDYGRSQMTGLSYSVGNLFFSLLYRLVGRDAFNQIIAAYLDQFGTSGGSTNDLMEVIRRTAGMDLERLISDWIYTTQWTERVEQATDIHNLESYYRNPRQPASPND